MECAILAHLLIQMNPPTDSGFTTFLRRGFHQALLDGPLTCSGGIPTNANKESAKSILYAKAMMGLLEVALDARGKQAGQLAGANFAAIVEQFLKKAFQSLSHLRPGTWKVMRDPKKICQVEEYQHLAPLLLAMSKQPILKASLEDFLIKPDIVIARESEPDSNLNQPNQPIVDAISPLHSPLRRSNNKRMILHASVSCKWTIRSDRSQNSRTEALNLIRNRKGKVPHAVAVTAEPLPSRLGSIAYGTGDLDCIYHIALPELIAVCEKHDDAEELMVMVEGRRLRDISDLPLDLVV